MTFRTAFSEDIPALAVLMRVSLGSLGTGFYDAMVLERMVEYIAIPDPVIIGDGTYFVVEVDGRAAACGGWSKRKKLYTGSDAEEEGATVWADPRVDAAKIRAFFVHPDFARRGIGRRILAACEEAARAGGFGRAELMALHPGVPLYRSCGYESLEPTSTRLPDGTIVPTVRMGKEL